LNFVFKAAPAEVFAAVRNAFQRVAETDGTPVAGFVCRVGAGFIDAPATNVADFCRRCSPDGTTRKYANRAFNDPVFRRAACSIDDFYVDVPYKAKSSAPAFATNGSCSTRAASRT
jgi:hypothetical protein